MTYKHAACGNDLGGGKAVIIGDPSTIRTDELMLAYARFVDRLQGRYLTAEDVGTTQADMDLIRTVTPHVTGVSEHLGGSGDPSPATAWGVLHAMHTVAERVWESANSGGGTWSSAAPAKWAPNFAALPAREGARLTLSDVRTDVVRALSRKLASGSRRSPGTGTHDRMRHFQPVHVGRGARRGNDPAVAVPGRMRVREQPVSDHRGRRAHRRRRDSLRPRLRRERRRGHQHRAGTLTARDTTTTEHGPASRPSLTRSPRFSTPRRTTPSLRPTPRTLSPRCGFGRRARRASPPRGLRSAR